MVMSNAKDSEGQLLCCFQNSAMWYRRIIGDVQLLQTADFVVPDTNRVPGPLSKAQRHKQWLSGDQLWMKTMKSLFKGMSNADASMPVCYIDLFPYDAWCENDQCFEHFFLWNVLLLFISFSFLLNQDMSFVRASTLTSLQNGSQPQQVLSIIWARDDSGTDMRKSIEEFLRKTTQSFLQKLMEQKKDLLEGFGYTPGSLAEGIAPTYDERDFNLSMPTNTDGKLLLPLRAEKLEELSFTRHKDAFDQTMKEHNEKFNPSGVAYHAKKRKAETAQGAGQKMLKLEASETQLKDLAQPVVSFQVENMSDICCHIDQKLQVWIMSTNDAVVSKDCALMLAYGEYRTGSEVAQRKDKGAYLLDLKMDAHSEAYFFHEDLAKLKPAFEGKVCDFKTFLNYLEVKGVVNPDFVAHSVEAVKEKEGEYGIKTKEECAFEPKKVPTNQASNHQNGLSLLDWQTFSDEDQFLVRFRLKYVDGKNATGIFPQKPGLFLKDALEMKGGKLYCLSKKQSQS